MRLRVLQVGDPRLRRKSAPIAGATPELRALAEDMIETMRAHDGVGLAAPQVGINRRLVVVEVPEDQDAEELDWTATQLLVLLNPEVREMEDFEEKREGCLSLPGYITYINRAEHITAFADTMDGKQISIDASGLLAQAIQHEVEHLDGILIQDHAGGIGNLIRLDPPWVGGEVSKRRDEDAPSSSPADSAPSAPPQADSTPTSE
jgi:peptide deformylase